MNSVSCDLCVYHLWFVCVFLPWGNPQLQSDWSLYCDHGLDCASYRTTTTYTYIPGTSFENVRSSRVVL